MNIFRNATKPTARNLFLIVVSILALDIFRSVRFAHRHVLSKLSDTSLNAYYYALKTDRLDHESWRDVTLSKALKAVPKQLAVQPLFLSIDDTMVEKEGEKFELRSKLFDHAAHNGSNYLNGHCMVSILLSFPVLADGSIRYISVPLGYRLWDKKQTKLEIAAEMVRHAVDSIGSDRQVFLLCDSWYPKGCVAGLVDEYENLDIICNARIDTVMYDLPPERTGKRGRPKKFGERLSPEDFVLDSQKPGTGKSACASVDEALERACSLCCCHAPKKRERKPQTFFLHKKIQKASIWTMAGVRMTPYANMEKKTNSSCRLPVIRHAGY